MTTTPGAAVAGDAAVRGLAGSSTAAPTNALRYSAVMLAVVAWSIGPLLARSASVGPVTLASYRMWVGAPITMLVAKVSGTPLDRVVFRRALPAGALFAASLVLGFTALRKTSVANATLIMAMPPLLILMLARRLFGERVRRLALAFGAVSLVGVAAVLVGSGKTSGAHLSGDVFAAVNLVLFTAYLLEIKRQRMRGIPTNAYLAGIVTSGAIMLVPYSLISGAELGSMTRLDWVRCVSMILVPGIVGHGLMTWAQQHVEVTISSLLNLASPVLSAVGAWLVFGQSLKPAQIAGGLLVLVGLAGIVTTTSRRANRLG